jgi:hypothetical protein
VFVRSICAGTPGSWSLGTPFRSQGGGTVVCNGTTMHEDYCSHQNDVVSWLYVSEDGSPLKLEILGGVISNGVGEYLKIWTAAGPVGTPAFEGSGAQLAGQSVTSVAGVLYIELATTSGSCESQYWFLPLQWRVGCKNCTDPLLNYDLGTVDCAAQQFYVVADIFMLGSSSSLVFGNNAGLPPTTITSNGVHAIGPFPAGDPVIITAQNPDNELCYVQSPPTVNAPCAIVDCGPTWYERCAAPNDVREWLLQGDGAPVSVRFPAGYLGWDADVIVYDGADDSTAPIATINGYPANQVYTSTNPGNNLLVRYVASQYTDFACTLGNTAPLRFVAACAAGCAQPQATFATVCAGQTHFNVDVTISNVGSTGSVNITNDGGAASVTATATGTYTVGPFATGTPVKFEVVGANEICSWTSDRLDRDCVGVGIEEADKNSMALFPNPNQGRFTLELPEAMNGDAMLQVLDLAGRMVAQQRLTGTAVQQVDLSALPDGLYTLVLHNNGRIFNAKTSIQH